LPEPGRLERGTDSFLSRLAEGRLGPVERVPTGDPNSASACLRSSWSVTASWLRLIACRTGEPGADTRAAPRLPRGLSTFRFNIGVLDVTPAREDP